jgi:hypothetical protein
MRAQNVRARTPNLRSRKSNVRMRTPNIRVRMPNPRSWRQASVCPSASNVVTLCRPTRLVAVHVLAVAPKRPVQHRLSDERQVLYSDLVFAALSEAARAALEDLMAGGTYEFQSDFAKKHPAKGRAEGEAKALLAVLEARGLRASDDARARILACTDAAQLEAWVRKAATATSIDELF